LLLSVESPATMPASFSWRLYVNNGSAYHMPLPALTQRHCQQKYKQQQQASKKNSAARISAMIRPTPAATA
jgi:hypothetical protein